jgi:predicted nucleic acid-binding protein
VILVDTSVWVDHFRRGNRRLATLLGDGQVLCHRFVIGELAVGNLENRSTILEYLSSLPLASHAEHEEVLTLVGGKRLIGTGVGWIDAHLLASALLTHVQLWSQDAALATQAKRLGVVIAP